LRFAQAEMAAFANAPGGRIFIGVADDGSVPVCSGLRVENEIDGNSFTGIVSLELG